MSRHFHLLWLKKDKKHKFKKNYYNTVNYYYDNGYDQGYGGGYGEIANVQCSVMIHSFIE